MLDAVAIEEVPLDTWRRVFDDIGYPEGLASATLDHDAIVAHAGEGRASDLLVEALQSLLEIGTEHGLESMRQVADAQQVDLGPIRSCPSREAAIEFWLASRRDPNLRELYTQVQMQTEVRGPQRAFREFRGKSARAITDWKVVQARLRPLLLDWCRSQDLGEHLDIRGYVRDGDARIQVIHGHRLKRAVVVRDDDSRGRRSIEIRPAHCDVVRYDAENAWLRISPKSSSGNVVDTYRRIFGAAFFDDPTFFSDDVSCSLQRLQAEGHAALQSAPATTTSARVTELTWHLGDDEVLRIKSSDCLAALERRHLPRVSGEFVEAKIAVTLLGRRPVRRNIHIRVPDKIDYPRDRHETAIEDFLRATGLRVSSARQSHSDLWTLHPWRVREADWREAYPKDVDHLLQHRTLTSISLQNVRHPDHPGRGNTLSVGLAAEDASGGKVGIALEDEVASKVLTATDTHGLTLDVARLAQQWRTTLGMDGEPSDLGEGAYLLGRRSLGDVPCALVLLSHQPTATGQVLAARLSAAAQGCRVGVLLPFGRRSETTLPEIQFSSLRPDGEDVWRLFVEASHLGDSVPAVWRAPKGSRLVVDRQRGLVWFDHIPIQLPAESRPFRLLETLAGAGGTVVMKDEVGRALVGGGHGDHDKTARRAKSDAITAIEASLDRAGIDDAKERAANAIVSPRHGFSLPDPAFVG